MRKTKRQLLLFSFYDFTGIQTHLEAMAAKGWMLESIGTFGWLYRRAEPKTVHFAVTYFPQASEFDPGPTEGQQVLQDYCAEAGWQPVARSAQMQVFCSTAASPVPLETDAAVQVENIHHAMKKNFLPSRVLLLALALLQLGMLSWRLHSDAISLLADATTLFLVPCYLLLLLVCLTESIAYFRWHRRAKAAAELDGSLVPTRSHPRFQAAVLALLGVFLMLWLCSSGSRRQTVIAVGSLLMMTALIALVTLIKAVLKHWNIRTGVNRAVTLVSCFVLSFALVGGMSFCILRMVRSGWLDDHPPVETYLYKGMEWEVYHDTLPLTIQDLMATDYDGYSTELSQDVSLLLSRTTCTQRPRMDALGEPDLQYVIVKVRLSGLYGLCKKAMLKQYWFDAPEESRDTYYPVDATPWGAQEAYQLYFLNESPVNRYLLCWEDRIVELRLDGEPTPEQMAIAGEKLQSA